MNNKNNFTVKFREFADIKIIDIGGHLDAYTAADLEKELSNLIQSGNNKIIVNFSQLEYISSAGLGVFMAFIEDVRNNNGDIKLSSMNQKVFSVFDLLGFPMLFDIADKDDILIEKFENNITNDQD
jgi:anti-sigma B factor antagonist